MFCVQTRLVDVLADAVSDKTRLVLLVERGIELNRGTGTLVGPQLFPKPAGVVGDNRVRGPQDNVCRSVVLL